MTGQVRHIVAIRFKAAVDETKVDALMQQLADLRGHLPGIVDFGHRENISPEVPVVHGLKHLFWFDFIDEKARDAYLVDPAHQAVGKDLVAAADGGIDGIVVLDYFL
ncbi:MAG: Dabb family protein [Pseudomonadota bacterium]